MAMKLRPEGILLAVAGALAIAMPVLLLPGEAGRAPRAAPVPAPIGAGTMPALARVYERPLFGAAEPAEAPADADWAGAVRARLERMQADAGRQAVAALPEAERQQAIKAMVDGLAERLSTGGGSVSEWSRLIRARAVLGDKPAALQAVKTARERLAEDKTALAAIDALADELALKEAAP